MPFHHTLSLCLTRVTIGKQLPNACLSVDPPYLLRNACAILVGTNNEFYDLNKKTPVYEPEYLYQLDQVSIYISLHIPSAAYCLLPTLEFLEPKGFIYRGQF